MFLYLTIFLAKKILFIILTSGIPDFDKSMTWAKDSFSDKTNQQFVPLPGYGSMIKFELWQKEDGNGDSGSMVNLMGDADRHIIRISFSEGFVTENIAIEKNEMSCDVLGKALYCGPLEKCVHKLLRMDSGLYK